MKIKEYISEFVKRYEGNDEKMHELTEFIADFFHEEKHMEAAREFEYELEELVYEIDEEIAEKVIKHLVHRDGTESGMKWTKQDTDAVAKQNGIEEKIKLLGKHYSDLKFWLAMNYVYAVHYNINRTINGYIELAIDELVNKNVCFDSIVRHVYKKL